MTVIFDAIEIAKGDSVAVLLSEAAAGQKLLAKGPGGDHEVIAVTDIPGGHKLALKDMPAGAEVIKYGQVIGRATTDIKTGEHVHIHNVEGIRGRGDRQQFSK